MISFMMDYIRGFGPTSSSTTTTTTSVGEEGTSLSEALRAMNVVVPPTRDDHENGTSTEQGTGSDAAGAIHPSNDPSNDTRATTTTTTFETKDTSPRSTKKRPYSATLPTATAHEHDTMEQEESSRPAHDPRQQESNGNDQPALKLLRIVLEEDDDASSSDSGSGEEEVVQDDMPRPIGHPPSTQQQQPPPQPPPASIERNHRQPPNDEEGRSLTDIDTCTRADQLLLFLNAEEESTVPNAKATVPPQMPWETNRIEQPINLLPPETVPAATHLSQSTTTTPFTTTTSELGNLQQGVLHKHDVLCFQQEGTFSFGCHVTEHAGNINFRRLIAHNRPRFQSCTTVQERFALCGHVVAHVEKRRGKFRAIDKATLASIETPRRTGIMMAPVGTAAATTTITTNTPLTYNTLVPAVRAQRLVWNGFVGTQQDDVFMSEFTTDKARTRNGDEATNTTEYASEETDPLFELPYVPFDDIGENLMPPQSQQEEDANTTSPRKTFRPPPTKASAPPDPSQVIDLLDSDEDDAHGQDDDPRAQRSPAVEPPRRTQPNAFHQHQYHHHQADASIAQIGRQERPLHRYEYQPRYQTVHHEYQPVPPLPLPPTHKQQHRAFSPHHNSPHPQYQRRLRQPPLPPPLQPAAHPPPQPPQHCGMSETVEAILFGHHDAEPPNPVDPNQQFYRYIEKMNMTPPVWMRVSRKTALSKIAITATIPFHGIVTSESLVGSLLKEEPNIYIDGNRLKGRPSTRRGAAAASAHTHH
jgi:hypothetical protein